FIGWVVGVETLRLRCLAVRSGQEGRGVPEQVGLLAHLGTHHCTYGGIGRGLEDVALSMRVRAASHAAWPSGVECSMCSTHATSAANISSDRAASRMATRLRFAAWMVR